MPPATTTCVAPVPRTAFSICCMPATVPFEVLHPFSQHPQGSPTGPFPKRSLASRIGSLNRSKITIGSFLKVFATDVQKAIA